MEEEEAKRRIEYDANYQAIGDRLLAIGLSMTSKFNGRLRCKLRALRSIATYSPVPIAILKTGCFRNVLRKSIEYAMDVRKHEHH